jgi:hypothetical protein
MLLQKYLVWKNFILNDTKCKDKQHKQSITQKCAELAGGSEIL